MVAVGYDIYVANNSQYGFFSDYNTLFAGPAGKLIYWTRDFTDILDWQDDVALYDLHSVGSTLPNPTDGMPHFVDAANNDFQLLPLVGGQQASDAALEQGSPLVRAVTQPQNNNLLTNPGFESGLTGWSASAQGGVATAATVTRLPHRLRRRQLLRRRPGRRRGSSPRPSTCSPPVCRPRRSTTAA